MHTFYNLRSALCIQLCDLTLNIILPSTDTNLFSVTNSVSTLGDISHLGEPTWCFNLHVASDSRDYAYFPTHMSYSILMN